LTDAAAAGGGGAAGDAGAAGRAGVARIGRLASRTGRLLVVADFDGTLAVGSRDPGAAVIVPLARRALRRLARLAHDRPDRLAVAILTGRTAADVAGRVRVGGITYLGDHGLQTGTFGRGHRPASIVTTFRAGHEASHAPAEILATRVPEVLGGPAWLYVERKGPSVAFHLRQADDRVAARAAVEAAIAEVARELPANDLAHYRGRLVVDLRPRTAGGKREAFEALLADLRPSTVVAFGDDLSDADGFAILRAARDEGRIVDGLAVAITGPHGMLDEVRAAADVVLGSPDLAARALSAIATTLEREPREARWLRSSRSGAARRPPPRRAPA
jgi:trehalose-phosphatase